jgi:PKD repeat protein
MRLAIAFGSLALAACGGGGDAGGDGTTNCTTNPTAPGCGVTPPAGTNQPPVAEANGPYAAAVGANVTFNASGTRDPEGGALSYSWVFGDATPNGTTDAPTHAYAAAGSYRVRLTVTDDKGATGTDSATVTVTAPGAPAAATGTLAVELTDAPFPFDTVAQANVFVVRVDAQIAEPTAAQANAGLAATANTDPTAGWVTVATVNRAINLLDLQNGRTLSLGQRAMAPGSYQGFRLVIDAAQSNVTLKGGARANVTFPSAGQIGLKLAPEGPFVVAAGGTTTMIADFDVGKSFRLTGANIGGGLQFVSSVRALRPSRGKVPGQYRIVNGSTGEVIFVQGASLELLPANTPNSDADPAKVIATTTSDVSGQFLFRFVEPGAQYTVRATPPASRASLGVQSLQAIAAPETASGTNASAGAVFQLRMDPRP